MNITTTQMTANLGAEMNVVPRWYVVMLPGETADLSELYGPFRSEAQAGEARDRWNARHATNGDRAEVLPISSAADLEKAQ